MRYERSWWAAFLLPTLVPELERGVSAGELLSISLSLFAGAVLASSYWRFLRPPPTFWLLAAYLALSFLSLSHDPVGYFIAHFAGGLAFTVAVVVGGTAPNRLFDSLVKWMFVLLAVGAAVDIVFDFFGWGPVPERLVGQWEEGMRGKITSTSLNGMYLAPLMAIMVASPRFAAWRIAGGIALPLVFYHVVVFGQGRGSTILAAFGAALVLLRRARSLPAVLVVLLPFLVVGGMGFFDDAIAPFVERVESEDLTEIDRIEHARVGERLVRNMTPEEILSGINYRKVTMANGGMSMHNGFFDTVTRYGVFATAPWLAFNVISLIAATISLTLRQFERAQVVAAAVVLQMLGASLAAPIFVNWRSCIVPGICAGLTLRALRSKR